MSGLLLLAADASKEPDPLALIIEIGAGCILALSSLLTTIALAKLSSLTDHFESLRKMIVGDGSGTPGIYTKMLLLERSSDTWNREIEALKNGSLKKADFEKEMEAQNAILHEVKSEQKTLGGEIRKIDRGLANRPTYSQAQMPAIRRDGPLRREDDDSDPPPMTPMRPRMGSRPNK